MKPQAKFRFNKILSWIFVFGILFPEAVRFYHQFEHTLQTECKAKGSTHFHQSVPDCSLFDYQYTPALHISLTEFFTTEIIPHTEVSFYYQFSYLRELTQKFYVRGPPLLS